MKRIIQSTLCVVLALLMLNLQALAFTTNALENNSNAATETVESFEEAEIYNAFIEVNDLVNALETTTNLSYSELKANNSELISGVNSSAAIALNSSAAETPPFISAFLWGCLFSLPGMLIVGITTDFDNNQMWKSAWGCFLSSLIFGGGWTIFK